MAIVLFFCKKNAGVVGKIETIIAIVSQT